MPSRLKIIAGIALLGATVLSVQGLGLGRSGTVPPAGTVPPVDTTPVVRAVPQSRGQLTLSYSPIIKVAAPAVVNVYTTTVDRSRSVGMDAFLQQFYGGAPAKPRVQQSLGSGVIVGSDGLIVTNNHVVAGADQILVALSDRREYPAKLVFADPRLDLALLKVDTKGAVLPVIRMGDSEMSEVGDVAIAIGNPFGVGQTVTTGIVSAIARTGIGISDWQFFLQTDAAINPGNSGGALLDGQGRLIGINTAIFSPSGGSTGIGFAIPSKMVRVFLAGAQNGKLVSGWIGVDGEALTADSARLAGMDRPGGVLVTAVTAGSPGSRAGILVGDVLRSVGGKDIADGGQLRYSLATTGVGHTLTVVLVRGGREQQVVVTVAAPPEIPARQLTPIAGRSILTGVTVANLSPAYAQELQRGLPDRGVVVVELRKNSPAAQIGLRPGDLIEGVGNMPVRTVAEVAAQAARGPRALQWKRDGQSVACGVVSGELVCRR
jgi:serine protease Do